MKNLLLKNFLVRAYVHLGYQKSITDYSFLKYSQGFHNNVCIIDLDWTIMCFRRCLNLLEARMKMLPKCLIYNEQLATKPLLTRVRRRFGKSWLVVSKLPFKNMRIKPLSILVSISRQPQVHNSIFRVAYNRGIPSIHFIGSNTPPFIFEYFVPCNIISRKSNFLYLKLLYRIKRRYSRQNKVRFIKAVKRMENKLVNTWRFHEFKKYRKKRWKKRNFKIALKPRLRHLVWLFWNKVWNKKTVHILRKALRGNPAARKCVKTFLKFKRYYILQATRAFEIYWKKKRARRRPPKKWEPRMQYVKPELGQVRHNKWLYAGEYAPPITARRVGDEIIHDFSIKALAFLKERLRRRDIIAKKGFSLKRYTKEQMWRDWNIKHPDALLRSPFWVDMDELRRKEDDRLREDQNLSNNNKN